MVLRTAGYECDVIFSMQLVTSVAVAPELLVSVSQNRLETKLQDRMYTKLPTVPRNKLHVLIGGREGRIAQWSLRPHTMAKVF